jgi:small membrane protein
MSGIQILLISGVGLIVLYYVFRLRSALFDLIVLFIFSTLAVYFILFPEYSNTLAHKLGVGRGADLLFYICILLFLFIIMKLFSRIRRLEYLLTESIRKDAIKNAVEPEKEFKR